jgi:hypothetical protein
MNQLRREDPQAWIKLQKYAQFRPMREAAVGFSVQQPKRGAAPCRETVLAGCVFEQAAPGLRSQQPAKHAATFVASSHTHVGWTMAYKLYVGSSVGSKPMPLVVMLHGCKQDPDDFAAGTEMNTLAHQQGCLVLYPAQSQKANPSRCWNWFKHLEFNHQGAERGEAATIASMAQMVLAQYGGDQGRAYIAACLLAAQWPPWWRRRSLGCLPPWACIPAWRLMWHKAFLKAWQRCVGLRPCRRARRQRLAIGCKARPSCSTATKTALCTHPTANRSSRLRWPALHKQMGEPIHTWNVKLVCRHTASATRARCMA